MARITVEDCLEVVNNRFELVMMAAKRARQLANGVEPQLDNSEANDKPTVLALREIAARRIDLEYIDAVEKAERERKEREALEWAAAEVVADDASGRAHLRLVRGRDTNDRVNMVHGWYWIQRIACGAQPLVRHLGANKGPHLMTGELPWGAARAEG